MSDAEGLLDAVIDDLAELTARVDDLEATVAEIDDLEERVARLEERTDMLRLIEEADQLDVDQRRAALWQHCVREARDARHGVIALDHDDVERVLHYPEVHRTTLYTDMREVADAIDAEGVARYVPQDEGETDEALLRVDLSRIDQAVDASTLYTGGD